MATFHLPKLQGKAWPLLRALPAVNQSFVISAGRDPKMSSARWERPGTEAIIRSIWSLKVPTPISSSDGVYPDPEGPPKELLPQPDSFQAE